MYFDSKTFDHSSVLSKGDYENCVFRNCDFSEGNLSGIKFIDCVFERCNLSMAKSDAAAFQDVKFRESKMLGLRFDTINVFGLALSFEECQLNHSSFFRLKLRKIRFRNCNLEGVDFGECDLTEAIFDNSNLLQAIFDNTLLEKADFRTAQNFSIDPERNKLKKARFAQSNIGGLLDKYQIQIDRLL
jgi:fluoroquinolone resistance protein